MKYYLIEKIYNDIKKCERIILRENVAAKYGYNMEISEAHRDYDLTATEFKSADAARVYVANNHYVIFDREMTHIESKINSNIYKIEKDEPPFLDQEIDSAEFFETLKALGLKINQTSGFITHFPVADDADQDYYFDWNENWVTSGRNPSVMEICGEKYLITYAENQNYIVSKIKED